MARYEIAVVNIGDARVAVTDTADYYADLHARQRTIVEYIGRQERVQLLSVQELFDLLRRIAVSPTDLFSAQPENCGYIITALCHGREYRILDSRFADYLEPMVCLPLANHTAKVEEGELRYISIRGFAPTLHLVRVRVNLDTGEVGESDFFHGYSPPTIG